MSTLPKTYITPSQYLEAEKKAEFKSEYVNGEVFAMAGASPNHNRLCLRLSILIDSQLGGKPYEVFPSDLRVHVATTQMYTYPDVSVACGKPEFVEETLVNPVLLAEVLSPSTEAYDRGKKFEQYRKIESLRYYLLISQDRMLVELYTRQADEKWLLSSYSRGEEAVELEGIGSRLSLADLYSRIEFEPATS